MVFSVEYWGKSGGEVGQDKCYDNDDNAMLLTNMLLIICEYCVQSSPI